MAALAEWTELENITQRMRLSTSDLQKNEAFEELLRFTASSDACECVIKAFTMHGGAGALDVLQTIDCLPRSRDEFTSSPHLRPCLELFRSNAITANLSTALNILNRAEIKKTSHLHGDVVPVVVAFASPLIGSDSLSLSEVSCTLIEALLIRVSSDSTPTSPYQQTEAEVQALLQVVMSDMNRLAGADGTVRLRYCTVLARIIGHSEVLFRVGQSCGAVGTILDLVRTPDTLLQMTALNLLVDVASTYSGLHYLFDQGIMNWLVCMAAGGAVGPEGGGKVVEPDPYLSPDALRCCAEIFTRAAAPTLSSQGDSDGGASTSTSTPTSTLTSVLLTRDPELLARFIRAVLQNIDSNADGQRYAALHALATFASSSETACLIILNDKGILDSWTTLLRSPKPELRGAVLFSIAKVIHSRVCECPGAGAGGVRRECVECADSEAARSAKLALFHATGEPHHLPAVKYLVNAARQPVSEMRHAACALLAAMAQSSWGLHALFENPEHGFWEYIQYEHSGSTKIEKEWKFEVLSSCSKSPGLHHLRDDVKVFIKQRVQAGAYFVPAEPMEPLVL